MGIVLLAVVSWLMKSGLRPLALGLIKLFGRNLNEEEKALLDDVRVFGDSTGLLDLHRQRLWLEAMEDCDMSLEDQREHDVLKDMAIELAEAS